MTIAGQIDEVIRLVLAPVLKEHGFRKSSRTFHRAVDAAMQVVNVQASASNAGDSGRFTLNVGVYFRGVDELMGDSPIARPKEYQCHVRERSGSLMGQGDHWWAIGPTTSPSEVASEVGRAYSEFCRPWLDQLSSPLAACDWRMQHYGASQEALALAILGEDMERAGRVLRAVVQDPWAPAVRVERVRAWARRFGLE